MILQVIVLDLEPVMPLRTLPAIHQGPELAAAAMIRPAAALVLELAAAAMIRQAFALAAGLAAAVVIPPAAVPVLELAAALNVLQRRRSTWGRLWSSSAEDLAGDSPGYRAVLVGLADDRCMAQQRRYLAVTLGF